VLLTGRRSKLETIKQLDLVATVDLSDLHEGERVVRLSSDRVQMELPDGVKIDAFQPSIVPVLLEPIIERQLQVDVKLSGAPAEGYEVYTVHASPSAIRVRGPAGRLNQLQKAGTETISLDGKKEKFSASNIVIEISDPKIDLIDSTVDVTIDIGERREEKTFTGIALTSDQVEQSSPASVTVVGPVSVISRLRAEDLKLVLSNDSSEPSLSLPPDFQGRITLKSVKSHQFSYPR
jgi:YbbR domain-containing protein